MQTHVKIAFPLQDDAITNDVVSAIGQSEEHCHDQTEEEIRGNMISRREIVLPAIGVTQDCRDEQRQHRRHTNRNDKIRAIAQFADK